MTLTLACALALGILTTPLNAEAQRASKLPRVGVLSPFMSASDPFLGAFRQGLRELGYVEGQNVVLEYRSAEGRGDRLRGLAAELTRLRVDLIVTTTSLGAQAAKQATTTTPIVLGGVDDAVEQGFVARLARPGGNVTGVSWLNTELSAKRLEILKEALPKLTHIAVLREAVGGAASLRATEGAARSLGVRLQVIELRDPGELPSAFAAMAHEHVGALIVLQGPMIASQQRRIVDLAAENRLPAIFSDGAFVEAGGLMSYGPKLVDFYRRAAAYVEKILKGARPGDLPVEQPTQFELRVNLRTAKALRLSLPQSILLRADGIE
jgi:putative tryptophan/tyrosine transport system substrate-binding protein